MTKRKQHLTMSQGQTIGQDHTVFLGVAFALMISLFMALPVTARPSTAQVQNGIQEPETGAVLSGVVSIRGTASDEAFLRYELAFNRGDGWLTFAEGARPVVNGTLAIWDTTIGQPQNPVFPDGVYQLRLRVVREDYNYNEYFVNSLNVTNAITPTPTPTETVTPADGATPADGGSTISGTPSPAVTPTSGFMIIRPSPLPSLTPFATPTRPQVPGGDSGSGGVTDPRAGTVAQGDGLLSRLLNIETRRFADAFIAGAGMTLLAFSLLGLYLLLRALARYLWRHLWTRGTRR